MNINENPFAVLDQRLTRIENLLKGINQKETLPSDEFCDIDEAAQRLKLTRSTIYKLAFERRLPTYKNGKRLFFKPSELKAYIEKTRKAVI
jgi:excisionase family DNA binding protein